MNIEEGVLKIVYPTGNLDINLDEIHGTNMLSTSLISAENPITVNGVTYPSLESLIAAAGQSA